MIVSNEHMEQVTVVETNKNIKHGLVKHPLYTTWHNMKRRIKGKDHQSILYYSGVDIASDWEHDFKSFYDWSMLNGWEEGLSIDRIDGDKGYHPDNCRWATKTQQSRNSCKTSTRSDNTSGYRGVWQKKNGRWQSEIRVDKVKILLGSYKTPKEAAIAYDNYIISNDLEDYNKNFNVQNTLSADFLPPSINHLYNTYAKNGKIIRTMTKEGKLFKEKLAWLAKANNFKLIETDCTLEYKLYTNKKGRSDLDNTFKAIQDALEGISYINDNQIVEIIAKKYKNAGRDGFDIDVYSK